MAAPKVKVHLLGGFLGSGKTTLLERLLAHEVARGAKPGVVMNEVGEADVDGRLVHEAHGASVDVVGLSGGCVCCDLTEDLAASVQAMASAGRTTVFVETTGLAAIPQVLDALAPALRPSSGVELGAVVGVVDATRLEEVLATWSAARTHLRGATTVLVNHADRGQSAAVARAATTAKRLAPGAEILVTSFADVDPARILGATRTARRRGSGPIEDSTRGFSTSALLVLRPVALDRLEALARRFPRSLVRMKGIVRVPGEDLPREVQWSAGLFRSRPFGAPITEPYLVAIGRRLSWDRFLDGLEECLVRRPRRRAA